MAVTAVLEVAASMEAAALALIALATMIAQELVDQDLYGMKVQVKQYQKVTY